MQWLIYALFICLHFISQGIFLFHLRSFIELKFIEREPLSGDLIPITQEGKQMQRKVN